MSLLARLSFVVRSWLNALLGRVSDPVAELDYSYEQLRDELQTINRGVADLVTQRKRLELHRDRLRANVEKHESQAREALDADREDLARRALEKKRATADELSGIDEQIDRLRETEDRLLARQAELRDRIEQFRTRKETMKARYGAAEASTRVSEALTGVGREMADVNRAVERATERTERMEARAAALEELEATGALEDALDDRDALDRELERLADERLVEEDLTSLKAELGRGGAVETEHVGGTSADEGERADESDRADEADRTDAGPAGRP